MPIIKKAAPVEPPKPPPQQPTGATVALAAVVQQQSALVKQQERIADQNEKILSALKEQIESSTAKRIRATVERDPEGWITAINMNVVG